MSSLISAAHPGAGRDPDRRAASLAALGPGLRRGERKSEPLLIEGYASLFGIPDASGDVVRAGAFARSLQRDLGGLKTEHLPDEVRALVAKVPFVEQADARPFASCGPGRVAEKARGAHQHVHVG